MPAHDLPPIAYGDTLYVANAQEKFKGKDAARHSIGVEVDVILLFDHLAHVPILIEGFDVKQLPAPEVISEHNMKLDLIKARFKDLRITFSGGDFGAIRYAGTATGVEFLNLTPAPGGGAPASK